MKLIFLDLDGVLVTRRVGVFDEPLLRNLARVVEQTGATIVLSSDWRRHPAARAEARRCLRTVGLDFIGYTPCMSSFIAQRPTEIMTWKKDFRKRPEGALLNQWIAIDDRALLEERHGSYLKGHFVQTEPMRGLTEAAADECVRILNSDAGGDGEHGEPSGERELSLPAVGESMAVNGAASLRGSSATVGIGDRRGSAPVTKAATLPPGARQYRGRSSSPAIARR